MALYTTMNKSNFGFATGRSFDLSSSYILRQSVAPLGGLYEIADHYACRHAAGIVPDVPMPEKNKPIDGTHGSTCWGMNWPEDWCVVVSGIWQLSLTFDKFVS